MPSSATPRQLDHISKVGVTAVPRDGIDPLGRRRRRRDLANAARLGGVLLLAELFVELLPIPEHAPDERPEPIVLLRIRQPLAAENDQAIELPAPGLQQDVEALESAPRAAYTMWV
jgi:hypothetical protein